MQLLFSASKAHDIKLPEEILDHIVVMCPASDADHSQNLCLDASDTGSGEAVKQHNDIPIFGSVVRRRKSWNTLPTFAHVVGLLRHTFLQLVS